MSMRPLTLIAFSAFVAFAPTRINAQRVEQATVPLIVESNRPFIELTFRKPDGTVRKARFLLDTGGGGFLITEPLARELGLKWGTTAREDGAEFGMITNPPAVYVGAMPLTLNPERVGVMIGRDNFLPPAARASAEGMVPGHVLAQYHVVFDYPGATFTIAQPDVLKHQGNEMPMPVGKQSGFPRTEVTVNGTTYGLLLDTGAAFTMVSEALLKSWGAQHPEWPRHAGAFGEATLLGGQTLETMFLPEARWAAYEIKSMGVVSQREGTFERFMSNMMAAPIVGSLAGNVLKSFRVELDFAHEKLYLSRAAAPKAGM
jgi:hypothetical protein